MQSIGIVGGGAIGRALVEAAATGVLRCRIAGITSRDAGRARAFLATLPQPPPYLELDALIAASDLVVEAAGGAVIPELARRVFAAGRDLLVISIGALLEHPELLDLAEARGRRLILPSGAIAGLDGIKSAAMGRIASVRLTTRKPPAGLEGAPFLTERGISLAGLAEERELFRGSARAACRGFPANVNVSAAVSLAGIGPDRTEVRILAVPGVTRNCHLIEVEGEFGRLVVQIENIPGENPRTGRLTVLSMIRSIHDAAATVRIGT